MIDKWISKFLLNGPLRAPDFFFFFHHAPIRTLHAKSMRIICITIRNQQGGYCTQGPLKVIQGQWSFDPLEALVREGIQQTEIRKRMLISVDINHATNRPEVSHFLKKIIYIFHSKNFVDLTQSPSLYVFWLIFTVLIGVFFTDRKTILYNRNTKKTFRDTALLILFPRERKKTTYNVTLAFKQLFTKHQGVYVSDSEFFWEEF